MDEAINKAVDQNKEFVHSYNVCDVALEDKKYKEAEVCFSELLQKYDRNDVRYNYALSLAQQQKFKEAKQELNIIIETEKNFTNVIENAKDMLNQIDNIEKLQNENNQSL